MAAGPQARSWRSGSSPPATAASSACSTARTSCSRSPARSRSPTSSRRAGATVEGPVRPLAGRGLDHHARGRRAHPEVRAQSRRLVTIGACATAGGIQALRNFADVEEFLVGRLRDARVHRRRSRPRPRSRDHVQVDFELHGCPINKHQLLEVIGAFLHGRRPASRSSSVCIECKRRGNVCVMVAHGTPCLGPVTHAGCGALCPAYDRGCYGCFGPMETPNTRLAERAGCSGSACRATPTWCASSAPSTPTRRPFRERERGAGALTRPSARARSRRTYLARVEGEGALHVGSATATGRATSSCGSTSRRASSRRCCAAGATPRRRTSPPGSAASARSPTR